MNRNLHVFFGVTQVRKIYFFHLNDLHLNSILRGSCELTLLWKGNTAWKSRECEKETQTENQGNQTLEKLEAFQKKALHNFQLSVIVVVISSRNSLKLSSFFEIIVALKIHSL